VTVFHLAAYGFQRDVIKEEASRCFAKRERQWWNEIIWNEIWSQPVSQSDVHCARVAFSFTTHTLAPYTFL